MTSELKKALQEEFGIKIGEGTHLTGKPRRYYCNEHGTIYAALVHDPYDAPETICPTCHKKLKYESL